MKKSIILAVSAVLAVALLMGCSNSKVAPGSSALQSSSKIAGDDQNSESNSVPEMQSQSQNGASKPTYSGEDASSHTTKPNTLSLAELQELFYKEFSNSSITEIEYDLVKGTYKIEGVDETEKLKLVLDASTKETLSAKLEPLDNDEKTPEYRALESLDISAMLSPTEAVELATKEITGQVNEWKLEKDINVPYYEMRIASENSKSVEVKVHAETGEILELDK